MNNIPDWMLTALVDVDQIIRNNVERSIEKALAGGRGRAALQKALTDFVKHKVATTMTGKIQRFYRAWYDGGSLVVDYEPQLATPAAASGR